MRRALRLLVAGVVVPACLAALTLLLDVRPPPTGCRAG